MDFLVDRDPRLHYQDFLVVRLFAVLVFLSVDAIEILWGWKETESQVYLKLLL